MWLDRHGLRRLLMFVLIATRGGRVRYMILRSLRSMPKNANKLASELNLNYKTVRHHLDVLMKNGLVERVGEGYGALFVLSPLIERNWDVVEEVGRYLDKQS